MAGTSPHSSGQASSPFGTEATLYSPLLTRNSGSGHRRQDATVNKITTVNGYKGVLPLPPPSTLSTFLNEMSANDKDYMSRHMFVAQLADGTYAGENAEHEMFCVQHQMKLYACFNTCVPVYARGMFLRFDDLHDVVEAKAILEEHGFVVNYVSTFQFALAKSQDTAHLNEFEGQVKITVLVDPKDKNAWSMTPEDYLAVARSVESAATMFGCVRQCVHVATNNAKLLLVFRVEFHSIDSANRAVQSLRTDPVWGVNKDKTFQWCTVDPVAWISEREMNSPHRTQPRIDDQGRLIDYRQASDAYQTGVYHHPHDQHNRVRRERILDGSDVRTTVMLRNIPNKMDWLSLKALLDEVCFGTYDFLYLRIDFKSGCNVGYAFINFSDVHGMIALIDRIERRGWPGFRSSKAAEISYATIQGREALVQKFRNSSVMQETPFCRPRLFFTSADAELMNKLRRTGTEQAFPRPDNLSKLQRSMDSARSIGLYPPNGYSSISEHRTRASAYDRGTPRDMLQAAMQFARQRAAPVPVTGLSDFQKREVEAWYSHNFGGGHLGYIPFEYIPMTHVAQYFAETAGGLSVPGVIGGPVNVTNAIDLAAAPAYTPTRGPRTARTPARAREARDGSEQVINRFI